MLKPIKNIENLEAGDRISLETLRGSEKYEGTLLRTSKSHTTRGAVVFHVGSGYTFQVVEDLAENQRYAGDLWRLVSATREMPDIVPGTLGDADFGGEGCPVQRIHPMPNSNPFGDPYVWMDTQNGSMWTEADLVSFRPDRGKTTQWVEEVVPDEYMVK